MSKSEENKIEIPVTQPFLPPESEYIRYLDGIWDRNWLTNGGPLLEELEEKLRSFLDVRELVLVSNGTVALQIAIKSLDLSGEIITTPFSYVATTSSIVWENCRPVFADIESGTWNLDPEQIEPLIGNRTSAILATHVFGNPCNIDEIREIADRHGLKVIYDAAHAFGTRYRGKSLMDFGDVSTASFHATKLFQMIEGGALITDNPELANRFRLMRNFGHAGPGNFDGVGINGKLSEFHAAMGLANLTYVDEILEQRKHQSLAYDNHLQDTHLQRPEIVEPEGYNYSYYPVLFGSEEELLGVQKSLREEGIQTRRYFNPSLNNLPYVADTGDRSLPVSADITKTVLCLPLYHTLEDSQIAGICERIKKSISG